MVQDAYDMGITTSLGGMPTSSFYRDDYDDYTSSSENDEEIEDVFSGTKYYVLKMNVKRKRAVLHFCKECAGESGNYINFTNEENYDDFINESLYDYTISECALCADYKSLSKISEEKLDKPIIPDIDIDEDEIPF